MLRLADIKGQDQAVRTLRAGLAGDRLAHGLLFAGPAGVGKATTAAALAQAFLCLSPTAGNEACGHCPSCVMMDAETHPDYRRVYRQQVRTLKKESVARDLSIEVIRDFLIAPASSSSQVGRGKFFVIEEAELMSPAAQQALLKTLEEPSGRKIIVLLTPVPGALLATVRSRCQPVRFGPLPEAMVIETLLARGVEAKLAEEAARLAEGSLGMALRMVDDELVPVAHELENRLVSALRSGRQAGGTGDLPKFLETSAAGMADKLLDRDPDGSKDQAKRESLGLLLQIGSDVCRRYLRSARTTNGLEALCRAVESMASARAQIDRNASTTLVLQQLAAELDR